MSVLLYSAGIAFCIWVAISNFNNDALSWIMVLALGVMAVACANQMIYYIRCRHEQIIITEQSLIISQCVQETKNGDWKPVKNVKLSWKNINHISAQWERPTSKSIRKNVLVSAGKKETYLIDPDIFDVFFLERKLEEFQKKYGNPSTPTRSTSIDHIPQLHELLKNRR
jgi:hypothetical protein